MLFLRTTIAFYRITKLAILSVIIFLNPMRSQLVVNLTNKEAAEGSSSAYSRNAWLSYCVDCPAPHDEGSIVIALNAKQGIQTYSVTGELVYCVPNYAEHDTILNRHHLTNRIVLVDRGKLSILEKIRKIQEQSRPKGIVVADDGSCDESLNFCGARAGSLREGGFAPYDDKDLWKKIFIPVVMVSRNSASKLKNLMKVRTTYIPGIGYQNITVHMGEDGEIEEEEFEYFYGDEL